MTYWNLAFDYMACFLFMLIFIWYFSEKRIPVKSHRNFLFFLTCAFLATGLEVSSTQFARMKDFLHPNVFKISLNLQTLAINMTAVAFALYIIELSNINLEKKKKIENVFRCVIILDNVIVFVNYFTDFAFVFENDKFVALTGCYIMYSLDAILIVFCGVVVFKQAQEFMFVRSDALLFTLFFTCIAAIVQVLYYIPVLNFMISTVTLTLYYHLQNPGAVTDAVTKQFNRKFMGEFIRSYYTSNKRFGVISVAMDDFKFINKTYGVENGDNLLLQVGNFLNTMKSSLVVFRLGSDQFCIVVTKNVDEMKQIAEQIENRFRHPWFSDTQLGIMMSASICCIDCPEDAKDYGSLIEVMDYSMALAKKTSKGKVTIARNLELDKITRDKAVEKAVKQAMSRDELMVYFQPIFSIEKSVYNSAEALVRLQDQELGWISPEIFIPISEKNGLIIEMGEMILRKVCKFIRDYDLKKTTIEYIEVNISPIQLMQIGFAERVKSIMEEYDVKPQQLNFEITETATIHSVSIVNENIAKLVEYGLTFSLDDYGSGYANIDYINNMPFKIIKLDKYIIWDAFKNDKAGITLKYTIGMLNALQLYIVAEGVETEEMRDHLAEIGCHYMQGWYYSKAVCDSEFMEVISMSKQE